MTLLLLSNLILLVLVLYLFHTYQRERKKRKARKQSLPHPVADINPEELALDLEPDEYGFKPDAEVIFLGTPSGGVYGGTSDRETWLLAYFAKKSKQIFEFGTCTGKTTYLFARNSPGDAIVTTLTLAPDDIKSYRRGNDDLEQDTKSALMETCFTEFRYSGTDVEGKVRQYYGDSKNFNETPFLNICDLVFIDGSHAYSYVCNDSEKALRMICPGGITLWHDYRGPDEAAGVYRYLNELSSRLPLRHIRGTSLVIYRKDQQ